MPEPNTPSARHPALDNLRVAAMMLGLVTHGVLPFKATTLAPYPIHDRQSHPAADAVYFTAHDFRMQLFFLLAGYAATALATRRGLRGLAANRLKRIALPLLLAAATVGPIMHLLFARHTGAAADPLRYVGPNFHLWFLYYLLLLCLPLAGWLAVGPRLVPAGVLRAADAAARWLLGRWWKALPLAAVGVPLLWRMRDWWVESPQGWRPDPTVFAYYLGFFLTGAVLYRHRDLLPAFGGRWHLRLAVANLAVLPGMLALTIAGNRMEDAGAAGAWFAAWKATAILLSGLYTWLMIEGLVGLFDRHVGAGGPGWKYLAESSYWCYLAGFPVQVALQVWLAESPLPIVAKFLAINAVTFTAVLASYELLVRHSWLGLLLNGKRPERAAPAVVPETVVVAARVPLRGREHVRQDGDRQPRDAAEPEVVRHE